MPSTAFVHLSLKPPPSVSLCRPPPTADCHRPTSPTAGRAFHEAAATADSSDGGGDDVGNDKDYDGDGGDAREAGIDTHNNQLKAAVEAAAVEILVAMATVR